MVDAIEAKETKERSAAIRRRRRKFLPLERDGDIVRWVFETGASTREQVQRLFFSKGGRSRCQERLTLLARNRYLERLVGRQPNQPDVYMVGRRSVNGLRLLRAAGVDVQPKPLSAARLEHLLQINACRVQVTAACKKRGLSLIRWVSEDDLRELMSREPILPDAYFQIARQTPEGERRSAFFLEVERSDKSDRLLGEKFRAYGRFYYGGQFERVFESRALRVLFLIGDSYGIRPEHRVAKFAQVAAKLDVTLLRFGELRQFTELEPEEAFTAPIWRRPCKFSKTF